MSSTVKVTVKMTRTLRLPMIPNFVRAEGSDEPVPIEDLTQDQLREIGAAWTEALMKKARERAGDRIARMNRELKAGSAGMER